PRRIRFLLAPGERPTLTFCACLVPQVRVRVLDANLGRERFGPAHRTFSTHDLWPSTPIQSPPLRSPQSNGHRGFDSTRRRTVRSRRDSRCFPPPPELEFAQLVSRSCVPASANIR